ncbi:hypothetical protein Tsp_13933 [Trichinella spiralis]|uniref:hypothetical protein n=1 Tax=Trichinella spiralis TaxID=6334 RepID=UPI0001EFDEAA|nr:hypothetical protein Tsp_13933 [Trichinella spiralis]
MGDGCLYGIYIGMRQETWTNKPRRSDRHWDMGQRFAGYWKIVLVNDVDHFIGLERECESQQKIMGRRVARKQAQKAKITNDIKIHFNHESQSNKLKVLIQLMMGSLAAPKLQCCQ